MSQRQLTKSSDNRMVSGVIAGIAEYFGWGRDVVTILRILFVLLAFGSWGGLIPLYFVASWIIPRANYRQDYRDRSEDYEERWNRKSRHFEEKMDRWSEKYSEKMSDWAERYADRQQDKTSNPWTENKVKKNRKMKEAEPIHDEKEEDWSDF